jgi:hypothetical protein
VQAALLAEQAQHDLDVHGDGRARAVAQRFAAEGIDLLEAPGERLTARRRPRPRRGAPGGAEPPATAGGASAGRSPVGSHGSTRRLSASSVARITALSGSSRSSDAPSRVSSPRSDSTVTTTVAIPASSCECTDDPIDPRLQVVVGQLLQRPDRGLGDRTPHPASGRDRPSPSARPSRPATSRVATTSTSSFALPGHEVADGGHPRVLLVQAWSDRLGIERDAEPFPQGGRDGPRDLLGVLPGARRIRRRPRPVPSATATEAVTMPGTDDSARSSSS